MSVYNNQTHEISEYNFDNNYFDSKNSKIHSILKDNSGNLWLAVYQKGVMQIPARTNSFKYIGHKSMDKKHDRFQLYNLILQKTTTVCYGLEQTMTEFMP